MRIGGQDLDLGTNGPSRCCGKGQSQYQDYSGKGGKKNPFKTTILLNSLLRYPEEKIESKVKK